MENGKRSDPIVSILGDIAIAMLTICTISSISALASAIFRLGFTRLALITAGISFAVTVLIFIIASIPRTVKEGEYNVSQE